MSDDIRMHAMGELEPGPSIRGAGRSTSAERHAAAQRRLVDVLEKHPEVAAYTQPASSGDVREVIAKLDEIADLLRRFVMNGGGR